MPLLRRERILPAAGARGLRRILLLEIAEDQLAIRALDVGHVVPRRHPAQRLVPLRAVQSLRSDQLEIVTRGARIERLVAAGAGGEILGLLVARLERRCGSLRSRTGIFR